MRSRFYNSVLCERMLVGCYCEVVSFELFSHPHTHQSSRLNMALAMGECGIDDDRISGLHIPLTIHDLRQGRK
jgi:hypothetical protein